MPTTDTQPVTTRPNINDAWCEGLFASKLQPSDAPTAEMVAEAVSHTMQQFSTHDCASQMAQESGDHPDAAAERMRWVRQLAAQAAAGQPWRQAAQPVTGTWWRTGPLVVMPGRARACQTVAKATTQNRRLEARDERDM